MAIASSGAPDHLVDLTADLVSAYVSRNQVPMSELPALVAMFHNSLKQASGGVMMTDTERRPAVPVKKSVAEEFIICLEDGKKLRMLKRYLRTHYNMSPEEYRKKWDLPPRLSHGRTGLCAPAAPPSPRRSAWVASRPLAVAARPRAADPQASLACHPKLALRAKDGGPLPESNRHVLANDGF